MLSYTSPSEGRGKKKKRKWQEEERKGCIGGTFYTKLMGNNPGISGKSAKAASPCVRGVPLNHRAALPNTFFFVLLIQEKSTLDFY